MSSDSRFFEFTCYHVYPKNWNPKVNKRLLCFHENRNQLDYLLLKPVV